ncbi:hypothetical protein SARC_10826 [Sphaeroforma arctica JP610]|uniref:VPS28 C-terminal domain-containing protein n=1 Tax=Sphaeroforma arctica JP610 TaxID=667725 RepID=A0A0L0FIW5_9EUKA|nr:hypothetical protein SARC_10826 [Sphaeroforma arctica JP610]KNC76690.1 hypothetical protein SARC_10826 [Sphaeroforma arctica JP610]|eukprot:XP_014150592.1 hypothetical protein SARC_10826 [Sphaeroforma arctica JP610]
MDSLKLGIVAVDEINPYLNDILESMQKVTTLPSDFEGKITMREWLKKTNAMKASDELTEDDVRQLSHDLEKAHTAFYRSLS